jgi:rod shape-determining protein MreD
MSPAMSSTIRYGLVVLTAMVLQRGLFGSLRLDGAAADVLLIVAVAAGIAGGAERGAVVGFVCGIALDLMLPSPFGLAALSYMVAGLTVGLLRSADRRSARWRVIVLCGFGCALGVVVFAVTGTLLGQAGYLTGHLLVVMLVVSVAGAVLALPAVRVCRWAEADVDTYRTAVR